MFHSQWSCKVSQECQLNTGDMCFWISIEGFTLSRSVGTIQQVCSVNDVLRVLLVMLAVVHPQTVSPVPVLLLFQLISKYTSFFLFSWIIVMELSFNFGSACWRQCTDSALFPSLCWLHEQCRERGGEGANNLWVYAIAPNFQYK